MGSRNPQGAKPFSGRAAIETPFGVIYSPNIAPDRGTGIGAWSYDQFTGLFTKEFQLTAGGLYPAFTYPCYTRLIREDVDAIRAYLNTLQPVSSSFERKKLPSRSTSAS